jgi:Domain of unknown function DUF29
MPDTHYDTDFDAWAQAQAAALRAKDWTALDIEHLAEEVEELRRSERRAVRSHLGLLWLHLLKWVYQPQGRERYGASWQATITYTRAFIERSLEDSPSLEPELSRLAAEVFPWARQRAAKETRLPLWPPSPRRSPGSWSRFRMTNSCQSPEQSTEAQAHSRTPWAARL